MFRMLATLYKIYFRTRGSFWLDRAFKPGGEYEKYGYLAPGYKWAAFMCFIGKHDWDLMYTGPESSGVACNDCDMESHTRIIDGISITKTKRRTMGEP